MTAASRLTDPTPDEALMTVSEVARRLRVSVETVRRRRVALGARRIGQQLRFRLADVLAYEDRCRLVDATATDEPTRIDRPRRPALKHTSAVNPIDGLGW